nr:SusC/RagA family TonB-linked outer membrane protein [Flavobacteriaceae bacterium]
MRTKFSGILTLLLAFVVQITFAQEKTITGTVSDETGPLPGVSIIIKGTTTGTETDFDGNYSISANVGDVLVFSFVGMSSQERTVGTANVINVVLEADNVLDEVVVVGYGTTTKKAYAGTAATIDTENLEAKNFANVSQALAGEVSGVTVINTSGQPGSVGTIRVRGYGSPLGNRAPLYVVDGVPLTTAAVNSAGTNIDTGILNTINPNDIKSTTVLKDATATAIYGSRGANGVVLITTKSGAAGKTSIEVDIKTGINNQIIPRYDVLNNPEEYVGLVWEGLYNRGRVENQADPVAFANGRLLTDNGIGAGYNMWDASTGADLIDPNTRTVRSGVNRLFTPELYEDEAFGTGFRTEGNLRISGGNEKSRHFFSLGYLDDQGYTINSDFKRYNARLNSTTNIKEWLKVGANLGYTYSESTNNGQTVGSENVFEFADKMAPIYPVFARFPNTGDLIPDPIFGGAQYDFGSPTGDINGFTRNRPNANLLNPIASALYDFNGTDTHAVNGNFSADIKFTDWLSLETKFGGQYSAARGIFYTNSVYGTGRSTNGNITVRDRILTSLSTLQLLRFRKSFGNHNVEALAAHETYEESFSESRQFMQDVITPGVYNLSNFLQSQGPPDGFEDGSGLESYFGQVNYNYDNKYFVTGSIRTDGSSRFVNEQWGTFGSVGLAWIASEEDFLADSLISYLKLKASWGVTGDQQGVATTLGFNTFLASLVGGSLAISENLVGDPNLTWETTEQLQGGLELSLGNWLDANFDYYRKVTDALFFNQRRGPSAGISSIRVNDGEVLNAGFEFDLTGHIINKEDFSLDVSVNGEMINNEMLAMPLDPSTGLPRVIDSGTSLDGNLAYAYVEGRSIFDFWMREWAGVDSADGAPMWWQYYDDANNNDVLDAGEGSFAVDDGNGGDSNTSGSLHEYRQLVPGANIKRTVTKTYADGTNVFLNKTFIPDVRGAFRVSGRFKNFDFSTQFTYSIGGYAYDAQYAELMSDRFGAAGNNFHTDIRNRWQQPGDITDVPLLSDNAIVNGTSLSSRFIISTDYLTLNNARIGYTMPNKFIEKAGFDAVNLWVSGDNLFTETAREGFNPAVREVGSSARRIYAPATTITLGVRVKF